MNFMLKKIITTLSKFTFYFALIILMMVLYLFAFFPFWGQDAERLGRFMLATAILVFLIYRFL